MDSIKNILQLPPEIMLEIIKMLDFNSWLQLYETCKHFRDIFQLLATDYFRHVTCRSASADILYHAFFADLSHKIRSFNLAGLKDLNHFHGSIVKHMNLYELNLEWTNLTISSALCFITPNLRRLHVKVYDNDCNILNEHANSTPFQNLLYINCIIYDILEANSYIDLYRHFSLLHEIQITYACVMKVNERHPESSPYYFNMTPMCNLRKFSIHCSKLFGRVLDLQPLPRLNNFEFLIFASHEECKVRSSPNVSYIMQHLIDIHNSYINIDTNFFNSLEFYIESGLKLYLWNGDFSFDVIRQDILKIVPSFYCIKRSIINRRHKDIFIGSCMWVFHESRVFYVSRFVQSVHKSVILREYCTLCRLHPNISIKISFCKMNFKNLTMVVISHLTIEDNLFKVLFTVCKRLEAIQIEFLNTESEVPAYLLVSRYIYLCTRLKSFYLYATEMNIEIPLRSLLKCGNLENVSLGCVYKMTAFSMNGLIKKLTSLIKQCPKLLSLYILYPIFSNYISIDIINITSYTSMPLSNVYFRNYARSIGRSNMYIGLEGRMDEKDSHYSLFFHKLVFKPG